MKYMRYSINRLSGRVCQTKRIANISIGHSLCVTDIVAKFIFVFFKIIYVQVLFRVQKSCICTFLLFRTFSLGLLQELASQYKIKSWFHIRTNEFLNNMFKMCKNIVLKIIFFLKSILFKNKIFKNKIPLATLVVRLQNDLRCSIIFSIPID